jgi:hypothetical protein
MALNIGGLTYQKQFVSGPERRVDKQGSETGEHSYHSSYTLVSSAVMEVVVIGVLKGVVRLDETQKVLPDFMSPLSVG